MKKIDWKNLKSEPYPELAELSRRAAAEGCVLLKNDMGILPICEGETISLFGRCQIEYYKSGIGSGGQVNVPYQINILDGIAENGRIKINPELCGIYKRFVEENPPVTTTVWESIPWSQTEYVPDDKTRA